MNQEKPDTSENAVQSALLFHNAQEGDLHALNKLLERERPILYDYLMRMTGQMQRSIDTVDELFLTMNPGVLRRFGDFKELQVNLIRSVRKFSLDIWNADTSRLKNAAFPHPEAHSEERHQSSEVSSKELFDKAYSALPGLEREALWLYWRLSWDKSAIAQLMFKRPDDIENLQMNGVKALQAFAPKFADYRMESMRPLLLPHPLPRNSTPEVTMELSQVIKGIKKTRSSALRENRKLILFGVLISVLAAFLVKWAYSGSGSSSSTKVGPKNRVPPVVPKGSLN